MELTPPTEGVEMKLEDQVCSLESAKRLKELGVKQESLFYWYENYKTKVFEVIPNPEMDSDGLYFGCSEDCNYSAFTTAELGELLPCQLQFLRYKDLLISRRTKDFEVKYVEYYFNHRNNLEIVEEFISINGDTEAEARAKMLIHLIENNLISIKE